MQRNAKKPPSNICAVSRALVVRGIWMLKVISKLFRNNLYIQLWRDRIVVIDENSVVVFDQKPMVAYDKKEIVRSVGNCLDVENTADIEMVNPFVDYEQINKNTVIARVVFSHIFHLAGGRFISQAPKVVLHFMDSTFSILKENDNGVFYKILFEAGAHEVGFYQGHVLNSEDIKRGKIPGIKFKSN
ncbi:MAG: hypothetical protein ACJAS1_007166 [Oleiphilaceae bacterium]